MFGSSSGDGIRAVLTRSRARRRASAAGREDPRGGPPCAVGTRPQTKRPGRCARGEADPEPASISRTAAATSSAHGSSRSKPANARRPVPNRSAPGHGCPKVISVSCTRFFSSVRRCTRCSRNRARSCLASALRKFEQFYNSHRPMRATPTPGHCTRCPHRSASRTRSCTSTYDAATASAASSTSTRMPPELRGWDFRQGQRQCPRQGPSKVLHTP